MQVTIVTGRHLVKILSNRTDPQEDFHRKWYWILKKWYYGMFSAGGK